MTDILQLVLTGAILVVIIGIAVIMGLGMSVVWASVVILFEQWRNKRLWKS